MGGPRSGRRRTSSSPLWVPGMTTRHPFSRLMVCIAVLVRAQGWVVGLRGVGWVKRARRQSTEHGTGDTRAHNRRPPPPSSSPM